MNDPPRYMSPALTRVSANFPPLPDYQDSAGGLTPTPLRAYSPAQQLLLKGPTPEQIKGKRAKIGKEHG